MRILFSLLLLLVAASNCSAKELQLPAVEDDELAAILSSDRTYWYNDRSLPQATWNHGVDHAFRNFSANPADPSGNPNREFPWRVTAGVDKQSTKILKFLYLPPGRPVVWWVDRVWFGHAVNVPPQERIRWTFPVDTVVGEILYMQTAAGWQPFEVRVRTRETDDWGAAIYRPYAESADLSHQLSRLGYEPHRLYLGQRLVTASDPHHTDYQVIDDRFQVDVYQHDLDLASRLLGRPFERSMSPWSAAGLVAPPGYRGGLAGVERRDCQRCHKTAGHHAERFQARYASGQPRDWYGMVRGDDTVFSWHPYDPSSITGVHGGIGRARINREFVAAGLVERYDPEEHRSPHYTQIHELTGEALRK